MLKDYIVKYGCADENEAVDLYLSFGDGTAALTYSDRFVCESVEKLKDVHHLLEARLFDNIRELRLIRENLSAPFSYRLIDDDVYDSMLKQRGESITEYVIDEVQYLDIDRKRSANFSYYTTGGGHYELPVENAERVIIRKYISYSEQGIAQITDQRLLCIKKRGE